MISRYGKLVSSATALALAVALSAYGGGGVLGAFTSSDFERFTTLYQSKRQLKPHGYKLLAESPKRQFGGCFDPEDNFFNAMMNVTKKNEPDKYQIVIQKTPDLEDPASFVEEHRGYMNHGNTNFSSDTQEKTELKFFRNKKEGAKPFLLAEIKGGDGRVKRMCYFYIGYKLATTP